MTMTVPHQGATLGGVRRRGLADCLAAMLCAGCAPGPEWWRPPRPKADAVAPAAPMHAWNAMRLSDPLLAAAAAAIEAPRQPAHACV